MTDLQLASLLSRVRTPGRYAGGERGAVRKNWEEMRLRACLLFPDLYELGMSYLGTRILYHIINRRADALAERCYAPADDLYQLLKNGGAGKISSVAAESGNGGPDAMKSGFRLWSLESRRALCEFDALLASFTYELAYPQFLRMLDAGGVPILAADRGERDPIVLAGGGCAANPEPLAMFVDAWGIGDGEKLIDPILDSLFETAGAPRRERLRALAAIPGVYVPSLYECEYRGGKFSAINPLDDAAPASIHRAVEMDMDKCPIPPSFPIPIVESVSGKAAIEIMRGCPEGCRFCQAGYSYRPARVRGAKSIRDAAVWLAASAGWDEITLQSLSALNHPDIARIFRELREVLDPLRVSVALPSLRMDALSRELAADIRRPRETSLTFAIEAGSGRLRDAINKRVGEDDIFATLDAALEAGWHKFKLYFMCGFAGETMDDLDETSALIRRISARAKKAGGKRTSVHASMSVLVPKPVTPLAWQPMERPEVTVMKTARVARAVRDLKNVKFHWHDPDKSALEALFSRGDRRMGYVLAAAHARGVLPPTLSEGAFDASPWFEICADESVYPPDVPPVDAEESLYGERPKDAPFPWSHIDYGINEAWLARELRRFESGRPTPSCEEKCEYCGIACG